MFSSLDYYHRVLIPFGLNSLRSHFVENILHTFEDLAYPFPSKLSQTISIPLPQAKLNTSNSMFPPNLINHNAICTAH